VSDSLRAIILFVGGACVMGAAGGLLLPGKPHVMAVVLPLWGAAVAWDGVRRASKLRQERQARGQCVACGYDLTGNVSGTCPEGGTAKP
jgi:hypothetical protein